MFFNSETTKATNNEISTDIVEDEASVPVTASEIMPYIKWCSDDMLGVPNCFLRSSLCAAISPRNRNKYDNEPMKTRENINIFFTGEQIDQSDLDVLMELAQQARNRKGEFEPVVTTLNSFLKSIGRSAGGHDISWLLNTTSRLRNCIVKIESKDGKVEFEGNLLINDKGRFGNKYVFEINKKLAHLYANGYCRLDREQRRKLRGKPLALWLHGFYSSHNLDLKYLYDVESLRDLSGSNTESLDSFEQNLQAALVEVLYVTGWRSRIIDALINGVQHNNKILLIKEEEIPYKSDLYNSLTNLWIRINSQEITKRELNRRNKFIKEMEHKEDDLMISNYLREIDEAAEKIRNEKGKNIEF